MVRIHGLTRWTPREVEEYVDFLVDDLVSEALDKERRDLREAMQDAMQAGARGCKILGILVGGGGGKLNELVLV